jgi:uncharacterized protein YecE (DUF72 family)
VPSSFPAGTSADPQARAEVRLGGCRVRFGTTSWADRSLVQAGTFYPRRTMTARERLAFYAEKFSLALVTTTFRFPPTPDLAARWAERTPPGFVFDIRVWSLLTGAPTLPDSLWPDLQPALPARYRDARRLYRRHLPDEVVEECWDRFLHGLEPLRRAGRLGALVLQYPGWWGPKPEAWTELAQAGRRLAGYRVAVEFRNPRWVAGDPDGRHEPQLDWLEQHGLAYVCVDGPGEGPSARTAMVAATADLSMVRFIGRRSAPGEPWTSPWRYQEDELADWVPPLRELAACSREVHVVMDNGCGVDAVDNALSLARLLRASLDH